MKKTLNIFTLLTLLALTLSRLDVSPVSAIDPAPTLVSIERTSTSPTNADSLVFSVNFSEVVQNVDATDFDVNGATTAIVTDVNSVDAKNYEVIISGGDLPGFYGKVGLDLASTQDITDLTGNALPNGEPATDETYSLTGNATWIINEVDADTPGTDTEELLSFMMVGLGTPASKGLSWCFTMAPTICPIEVLISIHIPQTQTDILSSETPLYPM